MSVDDIDIMMGTFTKSFGAAGGYIAGSKVNIRGWTGLDGVKRVKRVNIRGWTEALSL